MKKILLQELRWKRKIDYNFYVPLCHVILGVCNLIKVGSYHFVNFFGDMVNILDLDQILLEVNPHTGEWSHWNSLMENYVPPDIRLGNQNYYHVVHCQSNQLRQHPDTQRE